MMKKMLLLAMTFAVTVALLSAAITPAAAAGAEKSITLIGGDYIIGKGVVFTFYVNGDFGNQDFNGNVTINGETFKLVECHYKANGNLACTAEQGLSKYIGQTASATVNGFTSSGKIRGFNYCYPVYDWDQAYIWGQIGTSCQETPANEGDTIIFTSPDWVGVDDDFGGFTGNYYYNFYTPFGIQCFPQGPGYYYHECQLQNPN